MLLCESESCSINTTSKVYVRSSNRPRRETMEQVDVVKHFKDVANRYDELYGFVYEELSQLTVKHLQLNSDDLLVDVGAGTGAISHLIWKKAGLSVIALLAS